MSFRDRLVFWLGRGNLDLPLWRLEPVRDEVEVDGEGEAEVEARSGPILRIALAGAWVEPP